MPSAPDSLYVERTRLARQRSGLAFLLIAALLATHAHEWLGISAALLVAAVGLRARSPRELALATGFAAAAAAVIVSA